MSRIWKKPNTVRGKKALAKSLHRNFKAVFRAGSPRTVDEIMQRYLANKTPEQQKVLKELTRARAGVDSFQKQSAARAERIDFLYGEIRPKAKAIAQMLPKLSSLKRLTPEKALPRLKMFRANFGLMLELLEEIRFERYKYARQLSREQKEKYWKDLPENPNPAEFKALRESAAEFDKTIAKIERRQEIDSEEWADMFARLGMRILSVFEGRPRKLP